jgi:hypothetical protein
LFGFLQINSIFRAIKNKSFYLFLFPVLLVVGMVYYFNNPAESWFFLKCPVNYVTGLSCPGCGSQRAIHELLHLNFKQAFAYNPLLIAAIPYTALGIAFNTETLKTRYPKTRKFFYGQRALYVVLVVVILFFILRNI